MKRSIIKLTERDDYGLYIARTRGPYNTSLHARGTLDFIPGLSFESVGGAVFFDMTPAERGL